MLRRILGLFCLTGSLAGFACAQDDTYVDPAKAPKSYELQGEYLGKVDGMKTGVQVIALGNDEFEMVAYLGGLPGEGWKKGDRRVAGLKGKLADGAVVFTNDKGMTATLKDGKILFGEDGGDGTAEKVQRESPTLGKEPPEGAIVLFDGESAEAFEGGKLTMDDLLAAGTESKQKFGDHSLHVEFRTPFKPKARGQARGNSGVYVQGRYEIQVLDSFGLEGKNNECGGIYSIAEPDVNMCYPPLVWQTYDIDFTAAKYEGDEKTENARVTIKHNGVVIHDDLELPKGTPGKLAEGPGPGPLYLQGHGNPVVFKNIWVVEK